MSLFELSDAAPVFSIDNQRPLYHNLNGFCVYNLLNYIVIIDCPICSVPMKYFFYQDGKLE